MMLRIDISRQFGLSRRTGKVEPGTIGKLFVKGQVVVMIRC
jgi:hypothetical protein